ncbi:hypothetical protein KDW54_14285 [Burkholderia ambifaria]|uniref:hypothetical protein n=1 Tax=Burkholderia ambifaria TaxID=152480 RepID=UPI001B941EFB|nr:hypothetical protein [Burkholderia ambifaria]MBR8183563.1 hypothetical protein [Burkholderia ambifaria]
MAASFSGAQCAACVDRRTATAILRSPAVGKKCPTGGTAVSTPHTIKLRGREAGLRHVRPQDRVTLSARQY